MPIDRGLIDQQLQALGESPTCWEWRELRDLPSVLHADERIAAITRGRITRRDPLRRTWLIVLTDRRLLCLRSAARSGWKQEEMAARLITRTALRVGPFRSRVLVSGGGYTYRLYVKRADGYKLRSALSTISSPARESLVGFGPTLMLRRIFNHMLDLPAAALNSGNPPPPPAVPDNTQDRIDQLEQEVENLREQVLFLERLLHEKHLTPEEHILGAG